MTDEDQRTSRHAVNICVEAIPNELKDRDQWLMWDASADAPRRPHWRGNFGISWSDPEDWHSFSEVVEAAQSQDSWGIGYVMAADLDAEPTGAYACIDIDRGLNKNGDLKEWVPDLSLFTDAATYIEKSPSKTGLHIPVHGQDVPHWWTDGQIDDHEGIDLLTNKFCTFTGDTIDASGSAVANIDFDPWLADAYLIIHGESPQPELKGVQEYGRDNSLDEKQVREALDHVDEGLHYNEWLRVGFAVYDWDSGSTGKEVFEEWSRSNPKWDSKRGQPHIDDIWDNDSPNGSVTVGTLVYHAKQGGWDPPFIRPTEDEEPVSETQDHLKAATNDPPRQPAIENTAELPRPHDVAVDMGHDGAKALKGVSYAERAYHAWQLLRPHLDILVSLPDETLFAYEDGVWRDGCTQVLREAGSHTLGPYYSRGIRKELKEKVATTDGFPREDLGVESGTVPVENGLLDLETRELRDLKPEDYALRKLPVPYKPDAEAPRWKKFIEESVEPDRVEAIQEYVGYCLHVGDMPFHRALLLVGTGSNGKSTFLNIVTDLLGAENTTGYSLAELVDDEYYVAEMQGAIANIDPDVGDWINNPSMFKKLVGGDRKVSARHPYGKPFDFIPTAKQLFAANEVPGTSVDDDAFFRRWLIVQFPKTFTAPGEPGPDKDPELEETLQEELPGILNWALDGYDRLMEQGHFTNEGSAEDKWDRWQSWGDSIDRFISECIDADSDGKHQTGDVYARYKAWCTQQGVTPEEQSSLTKRIKRIDSVRYSSSFRFDGSQERGFKGFTYTTDAPPPTKGEPAGTPGDQTTLGCSQKEAIKRLHQTVRDLVEKNDNNPVAVDKVVSTLEGDLGERDPEHLIERELKAGELYEPREGMVRPT